MSYRKGMLYPHNILEGFGNGCLLDLRVRMAANLLASPAFAGLIVDIHHENKTQDKAKIIAGLALDMAEELTAQGAERGWIDPLPTGGELDQVLRDQARATATYGTLQQIEGARAAQDEAQRVVPAAPTIIAKKH